jgi:aminocarboxymuconate-semialdehyde decarboxylase
MFDGKKNRYGRTAARHHRTLGRARRPATTTIDIHCHTVIPAGAQIAGPHVDLTKVPLAYFANSATKEINALQEKDRAKVMVDIDSRLFDMEAMGVDIQVVAPAPPQCYYSVDAEIGERAHNAVNEGVAEFVSRRPDRFVGLGVTTMQAPDLAVSELETAITKLGLKGVQILTSVNGSELSDPNYRPFFAKAEELGAFIMLHPNGFTEGRRFTDYYFNNVVGNPLETTLALHQLIFSGTLARFPELKVLAVHGGGYLPAYSGRIDHAWGARDDSHASLPLPPSTYLRQVYFDTVVFTEHQLAYLIDVFGADRILMGTDYPFDMGEYDPIGHVSALDLDAKTFSAVCGGNAALALSINGA